MSEIFEVADSITGIARRIRRMTAERLHVPGITPGRLRALRHLEAHGPIRMGELAGYLGVAPRSVTDMVDELADTELAQRVPDPQDRRATLVETTTKGRRLLKSAEKIRLQVIEEIFSDLSETQLADLRQLLARALPERWSPGP